MAKELEAENLRSPKSDRLEDREPDKPMLDNRDMCGIMCIICSVLITYFLFINGFIIYYTRIQLAGIIASVIFTIFIVLFWTTQKIVRICYKRAKRKATDKVGD